MSERCILIVNADDFGASAKVSRAIVRAHADGVVTSTSLMVRSPYAADAVELSREHPSLGLGLHLDLGEWYLRDATWQQVYHVVDLNDAHEVAREVERQIEAFEQLTGAAPTHIDSHQHVHRDEPVLSIARQAARRLGVPLRHTRRGARYHGDFYGQDERGDTQAQWITAEALIALIELLPTGVHEIACHPGERDDPVIASTMYTAERARELEALCDPRVRAAIDRLGIELRSFADAAALIVG